MMSDEMPKSLDVFLALLGEIDMIKNQVSSLDKDTHIILAHDEVSSMMGNAECFRILKLIETLNANICGLNASILNAAEIMVNQNSNLDGLDIKKNEQPPEIMLDDEAALNKMNEMIEEEMQNKSTDKEGKKNNEVISNMLQYFKERFEGND
jgi:dGTP triphosphohydrolase